MVASAKGSRAVEIAFESDSINIPKKSEEIGDFMWK
jgi:hypothetical protein